MNNLLLTKELYDKIVEKCDDFEERTGHDVDVSEILYTFFNNDDFDLSNGNNGLYILNDWDEGPNNDKYWNHELNEHSAVVFIAECCDWLKNLGK